MQQINLHWAKVILAVILLVVQTVNADASGQIEKESHLSTKRAFFSTAQTNQSIFFVGGFEHSDFVASNVIDIFNLTSGMERSINLTTPRGRISTAIIEPYIYMAGGHFYDCGLWKYITNFVSFTTPSVNMTCGPTIRRPIRLAFHNDTITAIGHFNVEFMDVITQKWSFNSELTRVMSQLYDTTTISHNNLVFVIGGNNASTHQPSTSVWIADSVSSMTEVRDIVNGTFVSSWFDTTHSALVIQFSEQCAVYHLDTRSWRTMASQNNSIASGSLFNSTVVIFSDGFWTHVWSTNSSTWTPFAGITYGFTVVNQLVLATDTQFHVFDSAGHTKMSRAEGTIIMGISSSTTTYVMVTTTGQMFLYINSGSILAQSIPPFTPLKIFRGSAGRVFVIGRNETNSLNVITCDDIGGVVPPILPNDIPFVPEVIIGEYLIGLSSGLISTVNNPSGTYSFQGYSSPVWVQLDDALYVMGGTEDLMDEPSRVVPYDFVDVYNYIEEQWEDSIPLPENINSEAAYVPLAVIDGTLVIYSQQNTYQLNGTEWIVNTLDNSVQLALLTHPTSVPVPSMNGMSYLRDNSTGLYIVSSTGEVLMTTSDVSGTSQQAVTALSKVLISVTRDELTSAMVIYNTESGVWSGNRIYNAENKLVSIVAYGEFMLAFGEELGTIYYMDVSSELWDEFSFNNSFVPATMFTLPASGNSNRTTLVTAGGYDRVTKMYSDVVQFATFDLQAIAVPIAANGPVSTDVPTDWRIIVAIVVPIGVLVIAAILLTVLLLRRRQQRKKKGQDTTINMVGLQQDQFGQWFVPFTDIQFGDQLGQGANGQVFKGKWKNTDVALKVSMTQANQSVVSELSLMINMRPHPNVVQLFGFSVHPETNSVILILEFCNGGSLDTLLYDQDGHIEISQKLYWLQSISKGISHLHSNNVIHRDIAARNVLLHQGEPKITDFGLSRVVDEQQRGTTKSELGPIRWMSPESLRDKQYSTKSDVWSFGILMFEVLEQQEPHLREDPITIGRRIRDEGVIPQLTSPGIPNELSSLMKECCQMKPSARPTIEQVLTKLEHFKL